MSCVPHAPLMIVLHQVPLSEPRQIFCDLCQCCNAGTVDAIIIRYQDLSYHSIIHYHAISKMVQFYGYTRGKLFMKIINLLHNPTAGSEDHDREELISLMGKMVLNLNTPLPKRTGKTSMKRLISLLPRVAMVLSEK